MFTVEFWKETMERVVSTFAQALIGGLTATSMDGIDWPLSLKVAGIAALVSLLKCLAASTIGQKGTPSLVPQAKPAPPEQEAWVDERPPVPAEPLDAPNEDYQPRHEGA